MIEQTVRIWRCEHCRKHRHSRFPADHEAHCYANPERVPWEGELCHSSSWPEGDPYCDSWRPQGDDGEVFIYHAGGWVSLGLHGYDSWPEWQNEDVSCETGARVGQNLSLKMCPAKDRWEAAIECGYVDEETPTRAEVAR